MTFDIDKLMSGFKDYDKSMEPKKIKEDAKQKALKLKKDWFVDAIGQHIKFLDNDKHKIKVNGVFVATDSAEEKAIKEFSDVKELVIGGDKCRCITVKLKFKGSPNHIKLGDENISYLRLPDGSTETAIEKTRKAVMEKIRDEISGDKFDEQIIKFGSKAKKAEDEDKPVI